MAEFDKEDALTETSYSSDESYGVPRARAPPIPDFRFEQLYVSAILPFLTLSEAPGTSGIPLASDGEVHEEECVREHRLQSITGVNVWGVFVRTLHDQMLMPFLQGIFWGTLGMFYGDFRAFLRARRSAGVKVKY